MNKFVHCVMEIEKYTISWYQSREIDKFKKTLLLVHGIASSADHWNHIANILSSDFNIIILNRIGYGNSKYQYVDSLNRYREILATFISKLYMSKKIVYVGHSMGSFLGMNLCINYPEFFSELVLISPFIKHRVSDSILDKPLKCKNMTLNSVKNSFSNHTDDEIIRIYKKDLYLMDERAIWNDFKLCSVSEIEEKDLQHLDVRTLIIYASDDKVVSGRKSQAIHQLIQNSYIEDIGVGGHNIIITNPIIVSKIIYTFLE